MHPANKLLTAILLLLVAFAFAACGGGGGGSPTLAPPPANQQDLDSGGDEGTPPESTPPAEVSVPDIAKSAGEIGGVLADAEGTPVGDLEVYLDSVENVVSSTDESGQFIISGVSAGEHVVLFGIEGEEVVSFPVADYDDSAPLNEAFVATGVRTTSAADEPGSLRGRVTEPNGEPIAGVKVLVFDREGFFVMRITNDNGFYEFGHLPAGEYWLLGFKRGYRTHVGRVAIESGQTTTYSFTMVPIPVGGVEGVVTDEEHNPIPHTHVFLLYRERDDNVNRPPAFHTVTDYQGYYRLEPVPAGAADMLAFHPGYMPADAEVEIIENEMIEQNFVLRPIAPPPPPEPATLSGYVLRPGDSDNSQGEPIPGAVIVLVWFNGEEHSATSGENGYYEFLELTAGPYHYEVSKEGYEDDRGQLMLGPGENHRSFFLHPSEPPPGRSAIVGTVYRPGERNPDGRLEPVPGAEVTLFHGPPDPGRSPIGHTRTNERGQYEFGGLPPSGDLPYVVVAQKEFEDGLWKGIEDTHLREGEVVTLDIVLHPAGPPPGFGSVEGCVWRMIEGREEVVPGALVLLFHGEPREGNPPIRETHTNDRGRYCFVELPPSGDLPYVIVASKQFDSGLWKGLEDFHLAPGEDKEVDIQLFPEGPPPEFGSVEGCVWRMIEGREEVVPGALVLLFHGAPGEGNPPLREKRTNEHGRYCFVELPPSGELPYVIVAEKEFGDMLWRGVEDFRLGPGEDKEVNIQLHPPEPPPEFGSVEGCVWRMIEGEEEMVPEALVLLFHGAPGEQNPPIRETHTNRDGRYCFVELPPSGEVPYVAVAKKWFGEQLWQGAADFHLARGEDKEVNIRIFPPEPPPEFGSVEGAVWRMIEGREEVVPEALVLLFHGAPGEENPPIRETHTNDNGRYCFEELPPSGEVPYVVVAKKWFGDFLWQGLEDFHLAPGEDKELDIQIFPPEG